jgi:dihydrofolate reductase
MGRRTYAAMAAMGGGGVSAGTKVVVVSRTLAPADHPRVTVIGDDLTGGVNALKKAEGKDIWLFGGGELFRGLLDLGLVDTVEVGVIPVVLGRGIPFLPSPAQQTSLTLTHHRIYAKTGTVELRYDVARGRRPPARRRRRAA